MIYSVNTICEILKCGGQIVSPTAEIEHLLTDSRNVVFGEKALFFAIHGKQLNGHLYISQAHAAGVRNFVVEKMPEILFSDSNYILVNNSVNALQQIVAYHRNAFLIPVIGITGSNGKTIVKEWLYHLLKIKYDIVRSPKSYNSQIGVPLSVWEMDEKNEIAIFEAGISQPNEMDFLETILHPEIGIITNITNAHNEGFKNAEVKTEEKLKLFKHSNCIIYRKDYTNIDKLIPNKIHKISWSTVKENNADAFIQDIEILTHETLFTVFYKNNHFHFNIPFTDAASLENAVHAILSAIYILEIKNDLNANTIELLTRQAASFPSISMRLELKKGIGNTILINDAYSADIASLQIALQFLNHHAATLNKTVILSDFDESGEEASKLYQKIASLLKTNGIKTFYGIGESISSYKDYFTGIKTIFFTDANDFIQNINIADIESEIILLKGARRFQLEKITTLLSLKTHGTVLNIHLNNLVHNLNTYRALLNPGVKTMAMVKAFSYGSGQAEIARLLSHNRVDYLAVAYTDEGIELRRLGIKLPIMVLNPEPESFEQIIQYQLEPELYSFRILELFVKNLKSKNAAISEFPVHIKLDTGMHRLGFEPKDAENLVSELMETTQIRVKSIFSHLSSADEPEQEEFTREQIQLFDSFSKKIMDKLKYPVLRHIINSPGIIQFVDAQFDMVRLGIGLYGVDPSASIQDKLLPVSSLLSNIAQIKDLKAGDSVGYGRAFIADKPMRIAIINIGYADGFSRKMGLGVGSVAIAGKKAAVVGRVCMDMTMVDITDIQHVKEGDEVEIFGEIISISDYAKKQGTIAYEIMTSISQRVKRVYIQD